MPRLDNSPGAANLVNALQSSARSTMQIGNDQRERAAAAGKQVGDAAGSLGDAYKERKHQEAAKAWAKANGVNQPDDWAGWKDPQILAAEVVSIKQKALAEMEQKHAETMQQQGIDAQDRRAGFVPSGYGNQPPKYDPNQDPTELGWRDRAAKEKAAADAERLASVKRFQATQSAGAPVDQPLSIMGGAPASVGTRNPNETEVRSRISAMAPDQVDPSTASDLLTRFREQMPKAPPKIDPYSREGIDAQKEIAGAKPTESLTDIEAKAAARARGTNRGGGDPLTNSVKELQKTMLEMQVKGYVPPAIVKMVADVAEKEKNLREFKDSQASKPVYAVSDDTVVAAREKELQADIDAAKAKLDAAQGGGGPAPAGGSGDATKMSDAEIKAWIAAHPEALR